MVHRYSSFILILFAFLVGCSQEINPTLTVHVHDNVYDFIGRDGEVIFTIDSLDEFDSAIMQNNISNLIVGNRVILRCKGIETEDSVKPTDDVMLIISKLSGANVGVTQFDFDYTNH